MEIKFSWSRPLRENRYGSSKTIPVADERDLNELKKYITDMEFTPGLKMELTIQ